MTPQWFAIPFFYFFLFFLLDPSPNVFATDDAMAVEQRDSEPRERDIILSSISISKPASLLSSWKYEICHRSTKLLVLGFWIPLLLTTSLQARLSMKSVLWKPTPWNGIPFFIDACNHLFLLCFFLLLLGLWGSTMRPNDETHLLFSSGIRLLGFFDISYIFPSPWWKLHELLQRSVVFGCLKVTFERNWRSLGHTVYSSAKFLP